MPLASNVARLATLAWFGATVMAIGACAQPHMRSSDRRARLPQGVVRINIERTNAPNELARSDTESVQVLGVIREDGRVVAVSSPFKNVVSAEASSSSAVRYKLAVAGYHLDAGLILLEVQQPGRSLSAGLIQSGSAAIPEALVRSPADPPAQSALAITRSKRHLGERALLATGWDIKPEDLEQIQEARELVGSVVVSKDGQILGLVVALGMSLATGSAWCECARPELITGLAAEPMMGWTEWDQHRTRAGAINNQLTKAREAISNGNVEEALSYARSAVERDRKCWRGWQLVGAALELQGDNSGAADAYRTALDLTPTDAYSMRMLARNLTRSGQYEDAARLIERGCAITPEDGDLWGVFGWIEEKRGRDEEAAERYYEAIRCENNEDWVRSRLAATLERLGRGDEAERVRGQSRPVGTSPG